jgi:hypothetical protein
VLLLAGSLAFAYTWLRISSSVFGTMPYRYKPFKRSVGFQAIISLAVGLMSAVLCWASVPHRSLSIPISAQWIYLACTIVTIAAAILVRYLSLYGVKRWPAWGAIRERIADRLGRQATGGPTAS